MQLNDQTDSENDALLAVLASHGQQFLDKFGHSSSRVSVPDAPSSKKRKIDSAESGRSESSNEDVDCEEIEWGGIRDEEEEEYEDGDDYDDEFRSDVPSKQQPETIVFSQPGSSNSNVQMSKVQVKAFMSSKVSKLRDDAKPSGKLVSNLDDEEGDEEKTNLENDALLHKLVHTQLLSASHNADLNLKPAERRKAIEGRVRELAAGAKLGKGESVVRTEERSQASKKVRLGMERKAEQRKSQSLEEAKNLGNYHKSIKHLFDASSKGQSDRRKRDKGLKMGVGRFAGGVLTLSNSDFATKQEKRPAKERNPKRRR